MKWEYNAFENYSLTSSNFCVDSKDGRKNFIFSAWEYESWKSTFHF